MPAGGPSFSPFPFERLRRLTRREAAFESHVAHWLAARPAGGKLAALVGAPVHIETVGILGGGAGAAAGSRAGGAHPDPHAAYAEVRFAGHAVVVAGAAQPVRALAQRLLGGPDELAAPRPLTVVEEAIWALAVAAALEDAGIAGEVWPLEGRVRRGSGASSSGASSGASSSGASSSGASSSGASSSGASSSGGASSGEAIDFELRAEIAGAPMTVVAGVPAGLGLRAPRVRPPHRWSFALPIVVGRCALPRQTVRALAVRDVITVERCCEIGLPAGAIRLTAAPGALEARVASEYVPRDMALPDDAHVELTVQLGTTRMTLRQLGELAPGQIIALGRPLAGPYEIRAVGRLVGQGELVDVDGELGVRIVSIADQE